MKNRECKKLSGWKRDLAIIAVGIPVGSAIVLSVPGVWIGAAVGLLLLAGLLINTFKGVAAILGAIFRE